MSRDEPSDRVPATREDPRPERPAGPGLAGRLVTALGIVLVTAGLTAWLVAGAVGPSIFHGHLVQSEAGTSESVLSHAEEAFRSAGALSLLIALGVATLVSLLVGVYLTRRVTTSLQAVTVAVEGVSRGDLRARVPGPGMGPEFDELVVAFNDMAARLESSEELRRRLLADVAHELRTPVATLDAQLEGIEDGVVELSPEVVEVLRAQGSRLTRLAEDLAAVTRAESGETQLALSRVDPSELLVAAASAAQHEAARTGVEVRVDCPELGQVDVDPQRMGQVLANLVANALRHTPAGGVLTLRGEAAEESVALVVEDSGDGIAAEHLPHVFERFYRVEPARDRSSGGSGIGLAISKALVEAHGGTITAHSDGLGCGSTFRVVLPRP